MVYPLLEIDIQEAVKYNCAAIITGTIVSAVTGYICIKYFMKFISKFSLKIFGYYCIIAGIATARVFFNNKMSNFLFPIKIHHSAYTLFVMYYVNILTFIYSVINPEKISEIL